MNKFLKPLIVATVLIPTLSFAQHDREVTSNSNWTRNGGLLTETANVSQNPNDYIQEGGLRIQRDTGYADYSTPQEQTTQVVVQPQIQVQQQSAPQYQQPQQPVTAQQAYYNDVVGGSPNGYITTEGMAASPTNTNYYNNVVGGSPY